jgi:hypothetical protein
MPEKPKYKVTYTPPVVFLIWLSTTIIFLVVTYVLVNFIRLVSGMAIASLNGLLASGIAMWLYTHVVLALLFAYTVTWVFIRHKSNAPKTVMISMSFILYICLLLVCFAFFNELYNVPADGVNAWAFQF